MNIKKVLFILTPVLGAAVGSYLFFSGNNQEQETFFVNLTSAPNQAEGTSNVVPSITEGRETTAQVAVVEVDENQDIQGGDVKAPDLPTPSDKYVANIELANKGDTLAQYKVSLALDQCVWPSKPTEDYFANLVNSGEYDQEFIDGRRKLAEQCELIYQQTDGQNIFELRDAWLEASVDDGNPIAYVHEKIRFGIEYDNKEFLSNLREAFNQANRDGELLEKVIVAAYIYEQQNNPSEPNNFTTEPDVYRNSETLDAWQMASCYYHPRCDYQEDLKLYEQIYALHEVEARKELAETLIKNIDNGHWDALEIFNP